MKILAFSFAGGNEFSYKRIFPNIANIITIEYPGRGKRCRESLLVNIDKLVDDLYSKVLYETNNLTTKYIIYGHSMGALIGYLICKRIEELGMSKPLKLIVTGRHHLLRND